MSDFATVASNKAVGKAPEFERLNMLLAQREALEMEADAIGSELKSPGPNGEPPAGLKDPLVDAEGFLGQTSTSSAFDRNAIASRRSTQTIGSS